MAYFFFEALRLAVAFFANGFLDLTLFRVLTFLVADFGVVFFAVDFLGVVFFAVARFWGAVFFGATRFAAFFFGLADELFAVVDFRLTLVFLRLEPELGMFDS